MTPASSAVPQGDFSIVLGGPVYRLWQRMRLAGDTLDLVRRRVAALLLLAWLPLLLLSTAQGQAWDGGIGMPFLRDAETHARLLLALPLLIYAEVVAHRRMRLVVVQFLGRDLIPDAQRAQFDRAVASEMRLRDSTAAEALILALVYVVGVAYTWRTHIVIDVPSWYGVTAGGTLQPSPAGWWLGLVSIPMVQFFLLRWYFRLFVWARFLWQVSRIDLRLMPMHPDRCGGLAFLALVRMAFAPLLLAQGVILAGLIANRIFFAGAALPDFKLELIGTVGVMVFVILGPLLVFSPQLEAAQRRGSREYGMLAQRYTREFDRKWLQGGASADEPLLGSADIQSLADLANSFQVVKEMRWAPFSLHTVWQLAVTTLLPVLPLTLTMFSMRELVERLLKAIL
jgi:hypothetical protein